MRRAFRSAIPVLALAALSVGLLFLPGPRQLASAAGETSRAEVISVDNSDLALHGLIEFGTQHLVVRLPDGREVEANNELRAQLEYDKKFEVGDCALVVLGEEPMVARDHWRTGYLAALFGGFCLLLVAFGGWTGLKALFSFLLSCLAIWKLLIPLCLNGWNAQAVSFFTVAVLTFVIMYLVAGWTRKAFVACAGAMLGVSVSLVLANLSSVLLHVNGATMPFVQTLFYSGYYQLKIADIFMGATILGSSGAVMDLAMDIAAGMDEVRLHNPALPRRALLASGFRMGRAVVGTMTTTLLLAYSGGFLTLLMMFAAEGTSPLDILNSTLVSAEVVKTLVGSFGLVLVAPFTALVGSFVFQRGQRSGESRG